MTKKTITEEIERIKNLNKVISELDYSSKKKLPDYNPFGNRGNSTELPILDINNKDDRHLLARRIVRGDTITNATPETLNQIEELYGTPRGGWGGKRSVHNLKIDITKPFHLEVLYHMLKQKKGIHLPNIPGNKIGSIAYSKTFMQLIQRLGDGDEWGSMYRFNSDMKLDDFVNFMQTNLNLITQEAQQEYDNDLKKSGMVFFSR